MGKERALPLMVNMETGKQVGLKGFARALELTAGARDFM